MASEKNYLVRIDEKGRLVLPKEARKSDLFALEIRANEIILRPRIVVDPTEVISKKTLAVLDESMQNLNKGKAGKLIDLSTFNDEDVDEKKVANKQKKSRTR